MLSIWNVGLCCPTTCFFPNAHLPWLKAFHSFSFLISHCVPPLPFKRVFSTYLRFFTLSSFLHQWKWIIVPCIPLCKPSPLRFLMFFLWDPIHLFLSEGPLPLQYGSLGVVILTPSSVVTVVVSFLEFLAWFFDHRLASTSLYF